MTTDFGALIRSTMAKDPKGRPDSMAKFLGELRGISMFKMHARAAQQCAAEENAS